VPVAEGVLSVLAIIFSEERTGKLLGKALVALSIHEQLIVGMVSSLDGEANDGPLVPELLKRVHTLTESLVIFLTDSQYSDLTTTRNILDYGSNFVMRYHPKVHFHVRRITVTRDGKPDLILVTSLLDSSKFSGSAILEIYALR